MGVRLTRDVSSFRMTAHGSSEALMHPTGRSEYEWFRLLSDVLETGDIALAAPDTDTPAFGTVIGVVPTHDGAVEEVYDALRVGAAWIGSSCGWGWRGSRGRSTECTVPTRCRTSS